MSVGFTLSGVGALFGGVHCFAWWFHFPTKLEQLLWRICAVYCTVSQIILCLSIALLQYLDMETVGNVFGAVQLLGYVVCRIILLVLTLTCLRAEPAGIFDETAWTRFLPHIG